MRITNDQLHNRMYHIIIAISFSNMEGAPISRNTPSKLPWISSLGNKDRRSDISIFTSNIIPHIFISVMPFYVYFFAFILYYLLFSN